MTSEMIYEGMAAALYDEWHPFGRLGDDAFYRSAIEAEGGPALEVACGTGRLLVPYLEAGLDVEGIDLSPEMLAICRRKAEEKGLTLTLHQGLMQELDLERRFTVIYIPFRSFMILTDREEALRALVGFREHLVEGGRLLISLFVPSYEYTASQRGQWEVLHTVTREEDELIVSHAATNERVAQLKKVWFRYERFRNGDLVQTQLQHFRMRFYFKYEFQLLLERAGFRDVFAHGDFGAEEANDDHREMTFSARR